MLVSAWWLFWFMWHCCLNKLSELQRLSIFYKSFFLRNTNFWEGLNQNCFLFMLYCCNLLIQTCVNWSILSYVVIVSGSKIGSALPGQRTLADFLVTISLFLFYFCNLLWKLIPYFPCCHCFRINFARATHFGRLPGTWMKEKHTCWIRKVLLLWCLSTRIETKLQFWRYVLKEKPKIKLFPISFHEIIVGKNVWISTDRNLQ